MPYPPDEIAKLTVGSIEFDDWDTVWVQHRAAESSALFKFTCAEDDPLPGNFAALQFRPGDSCEIRLGGKLAMTDAVITIRQVAYDANSHGVMLAGHSMTWFPATSAAESKTGSFDNQPFERIARTVLTTAGQPPGKIKTIGSIDATPLKWAQINPGETVWDFLERLARPIGALLGSDHLGNFLLIGDHVGAHADMDLYEGRNILSCQCVISNENVFKEYDATGQAPPNDEVNGAASAEMEAQAPGTSPQFRKRKVPAEHPVTMDQLIKRAHNEAVWSEADKITATITVQGWLQGGTFELWHAGDVVYVYSPMAMLNMVLKIAVVTFTQDSKNGTVTTMNLVRPAALKDMNPENSADKTLAKFLPGEATDTTNVPYEPPPEVTPAEPPPEVTPQEQPREVSAESSPEAAPAPQILEVDIEEEEMTITPKPPG